MIKWEYKYEKLPTSAGFNPVAIEARLNELGAEGWEMVQAGETGPYVIFKRIANVDELVRAVLNCDLR